MCVMIKPQRGQTAGRTALGHKMSAVKDQFTQITETKHNIFITPSESRGGKYMN